MKPVTDAPTASGRTRVEPVRLESLENQHIIVTGGSRGIGAAIADLLAKNGARLTLVARDEVGLARVADTIFEATGTRPNCAICDLTDADRVTRVVHGAIEQMGGLQGLVNNAGITMPMRPFVAMSREDFRQIMEVNFFGMTEVTRAALPHMIEESRGAIVNIASMAGKMAVPTWSAYCSSKHAMLGFTKVIAREVALDGVICNAICPGFVDTDMGSREQLEEWAQEIGTTRRELLKEVVLKQTPQARKVEAESIATMTAFLLSNEARDITGQSFNVSCGVGDY